MSPPKPVPDNGEPLWPMPPSLFGLEAAVYQVKISYEQKPYRRSIMQTFGAQVTPSPSMSTRAGKDILTAHPNYQGSLGTAISEAIELATQHPQLQIYPRLRT